MRQTDALKTTLRAMLFGVILGLMTILPAYALEIRGIPECEQRASFMIPLDVNPRGVWVSVTTNGREDGPRVDCGAACLTMVEAYFTGNQATDDYVYFKVVEALNPGYDWSNLTDELRLYPHELRSGYSINTYMSMQDVYAQLQAGNPVLVHRPGDNEHYVIIYGYDGLMDPMYWGSFQIMSPTVYEGVQKMHLSDFVGSYDSLNYFIYRTDGIIKTSRVSMGSFDGSLVLMDPWMHIVMNKDTDNVSLENSQQERGIAQGCWHFEEQSDGSYIITSLYNGKVLDVYNGSAVNGQNVWVYPRGTDNPAQRWYLMSDNSIAPKLNPFMRLDVTAMNYSYGTNIQIFASNNGKNQKIIPYKLSNDTDKVYPKGMSIPASKSIMEGASVTLKPTFTPSNSLDLFCKVNWSSLNPDIVSVDDSGCVTGLKSGTGTIQARSVFNDRWTARCQVTVRAAITAPKITALSVQEQTVDMAWTASPATSESDVRTYAISVYDSRNGYTPVKRFEGITETAYRFSVDAHGCYTVSLEAVNETNGSRSTKVSSIFAALDADWVACDTLPEHMEDCEIEYLNHYADRYGAQSPGEGWVRGEGTTTYVNGDVVYSPDSMTESDTLVFLGHYYYHYCSGGISVERHDGGGAYPYYTVIDDEGQFDIIRTVQDSEAPQYLVYELQWNSGEYVGHAATCPYGGYHLYYRGYRYQRRTANTSYRWSHPEEWSKTPDPNAGYVTYRLKRFTPQYRLLIPEGVLRIEPEAFMNTETIEEVVVPKGCTYIGERAFADCANLRRVYVPSDIEIADNAFENCPKLDTLRETEP